MFHLRRFATPPNGTVLVGDSAIHRRLAACLLSNDADFASIRKYDIWTICAEYSTGDARRIGRCRTNRIRGTKGLADQLRRLARLEALYPIAARRLQQQLTAATFETDLKFREVLNHEINRFGASIEELEKGVSPAAILRLCEVQAVRDRLRVIAETPLQEGSWTFCRFVLARQLALASAEQRYRRLIRRAARISDTRRRQ